MDLDAEGVAEYANIAEFGILEARAESTVEIYKTYVITAEANIGRRLASNRFYFSVIAAVFVALSFLAGDKMGHSAKDMLTGLILGFSCLAAASWFLNLFAARGLSASKYETLVELEKALPLAPFTQEWERHKAGRRDRMSFTLIELLLPVALGSFSLLGLILVLIGQNPL